MLEQIEHARYIYMMVLFYRPQGGRQLYPLPKFSNADLGPEDIGQF